MTDRDQWRRAVAEAIELAGTPCYVLAAAPVKRNLRRLEASLAGLPVKHLLSAKTQPVRPLFELWNSWGLSIEVVSECELVAALDVGFPPSRIVVNGVAKHSWLPRHDLYGLRVHFDSIREVESLVAQAHSLRWSAGLRLNLPRTIENDPDDRRFGTQFGLSVDEAQEALRRLRSADVVVEGVQFHIGTDLRTPDLYTRAIRWALDQCQALNFMPIYLDIGGGLPIASDCNAQGFDLVQFREAVLSACNGDNRVSEVWLENGRFISGSAAVLAVRVLDVKQRDGVVYAICDGGRTNHALVSDWEEQHPIDSLPTRTGGPELTTICGPTCMAFDRLGRLEMPRLQVGDVVIWKNAGAYHIPWETRFSHGRCAVVWHDEQWRPTVSRDRESPQGWWAQWSVSSSAE